MTELISHSKHRELICLSLTLCVHVGAYILQSVPMGGDFRFRNLNMIIVITYIGLKKISTF